MSPSDRETRRLYTMMFLLLAVALGAWAGMAFILLQRSVG